MLGSVSKEPEVPMITNIKDMSAACGLKTSLSRNVTNTLWSWQLKRYQWQKALRVGLDTERALVLIRKEHWSFCGISIIASLSLKPASKKFFSPGEEFIHDLLQYVTP